MRGSARLRSIIVKIVGPVLAAVAAAAVPAGMATWARFSPLPSAWLIKSMFGFGDAASRAAMKAHVPGGVEGRTDLAYGTRPAERLDVWSPEGTTAPLPAVVWVHGGGWIAGSRTTVAPYLQILAAEGCTAIGVDYSLAPRATYPRPVLEVNDALAWILDHADELHVDPGRVVLAGDSAGAQIAGQVAALTSNPAYAERLGITPALRADQLAGTLLHCGLFAPELLDRPTGMGGWLEQTIAWSYVGTRRVTPEAYAEMSVVRHVTRDFPPTLISGGNGDPLSVHGHALRDRLTALGVRVMAYFWPSDHRPTLPHEFQFDLKRPEARQVLDGTRAFLGRVISGPARLPGIGPATAPGLAGV